MIFGLEYNIDGQERGGGGAMPLRKFVGRRAIAFMHPTCYAYEFYIIKTSWAPKSINTYLDISISAIKELCSPMQSSDVEPVYSVPVP